MKPQSKVINEAGTETWHADGLIHRSNGPAVKFISGEVRWVKKSQIHRLNAPAIINSAGILGFKEYWEFNNFIFSKQDKQN